MNADEYTRERLQVIGKLIDNEIPMKWGFFLMVFPFHDEPGRANYISNAERKDILTMMKNFIERSEAKPSDWMKDSDEAI